jgi:hypothetical protein
MAGELAVRPILWTGAAIGAAVGLVVIAVFVLLPWWNAAPDADRVDLPYPLEVPGPTLQPAPQLDLQAYRVEKQRLLDTAAWVDAPHGIARIPIADAMAILAKAPAPVASAATPAPVASAAAAVTAASAAPPAPAASAPRTGGSQP